MWRLGQEKSCLREGAMIDYLISLCTTQEGLFSLVVGSDLLIALAYFSIPVSMLWVFRNRSEDLPYPVLWIAFVLFIFACGATHLAHFAAVVNGTSLLEWRAPIHVATAAVSVATAIALSMALPKIALLPSPRRQQRELKLAVDRATHEKDALLLELNHRVGNQLAMLGAMVRRELRLAPEAGQDSLLRVQELLEQLGEEHHRRSSQNYSPDHPAHAFASRLRHETAETAEAR
jgi:hypothetical protein